MGLVFIWGKSFLGQKLVLVLVLVLYASFPPGLSASLSLLLTHRYTPKLELAELRGVRNRRPTSKGLPSVSRR